VSIDFEDNDVSVATHLGIEEDMKPAACHAPVLSDDDTADSFNRVAFGTPHPVLSKNPLPKKTEEHASMTSTMKGMQRWKGWWWRYVPAWRPASPTPTQFMRAAQGT
jgi:hypothetical protein